MIEIMETRNLGKARAVDVIISSGSQSYFYQVGGLPLVGDLQASLDAMEAELWPKAQADAQPVSRLYGIARERVLKAFALVVMDEINILRTKAGLTQRTASQIDDAVRARLKTLV